MKAVQPTNKMSEVKDSLVSIREALDVLGGKWKIPIMVSLACGTKRFKEIQYDIKGITSKVLARELKELEINCLITRTINNQNGHIEYAITQKCHSLEKVIEGLKEWGDYHRSTIFQRPIKTQSISRFTRMKANNA
jgi:DNA-binding HxlR family transcriptional regulator